MSKGATVFVNYLTNTYVHSSIKNTPNPAHAQDMHHLTPAVLMPVQIQRERRARRKEDNTAPRRARRRKGTRIRGLPAPSGSRVAKYAHHSPRQFFPAGNSRFAEYNAIQCEKRNSYRKKVREAAKAKANPNAPDASEDALAANGHSRRGPGGDSPPAAKKARRSSVDGGEHATGTEGEDTDGDMGDNGEGDDDQQDHEDDEVEDEEEGDEEGAEEQLVEDPIEMRENEEVGDDASEGEESD